MPRALQWFTKIQNDLAVANNGQSVVDLLASVVDDERKGATVTRIIYDIEARPDTVSAHKHLKWGITFVNRDAAVAGAYPDSDSESDRADWLMRGVLSTTVVGLADGQAYAYRQGDIRSQRVWRAEESNLYIIFDDNDSEAGGLFVSFMIRILLRLR